jgi:uncharacterized protein involved in outer membrane biogenesis
MGFSVMGIIMFLFVVLIVLSFSYENTIIRYLKKNLNEHLLTEIIIDRIDFSIIKRFPYATVEFSNVVIKSRAGLNYSGPAISCKDTLMNASKIYFQFGLLGLIHNEFRLKKIHLVNGSINIFTDPAGRNNYSIWKPGSKENVGTNYTVDFNNVMLSGFDIYYFNQKNPATIHSYIEKMVLNGSVSEKAGSFALRSEIYIHDASKTGSYRIKDLPVFFDLRASSRQDRVTIHQAAIMLNKLPVELHGDIYLDSMLYADVMVSSSNFGLDEIFSVLRLPDENRLNDYSFEGKGKIKARINGFLNVMNSLAINSDFSLTNGTITNKNTRSKLSHIGIKGSFTGNNPRNYSLTINHFESRLSTGNLHGNARIKNMIQPDFSFEVYSTINLNNLNQFIDFKTIELIKGSLSTHLKAQGILISKEHPLLGTILSSIQTGFMEIEDGSVKLLKQDYNIQDINGKVQIGKDISFQDFALTLNKTNFLITGTCNNLINYLTDNKSVINCNLYVHSKFLDGSSLWKTQPDTTDSSGISFPERIQFRTSLSADEIRLGKFDASEMKCNMEYENNNLNIKDFNIKFIDGNISGNTLISMQNDSCISVNCETKLERIDIQQLFTACNNFGQDFIRDENLRGKLNGNVLFTAYWDRRLHFIPSLLTASADVEILNGELLKFDPMLSLSRYISVDELKHIKFKTLRNTITISDQTVRIPEMLINSSAFNITLSGIHSFDNNFDYRLRVALSDVLFNKAKRKKKDIDDYLVMEDNVDETIIPISIIGKPDDFKVSFDSKKAFYLIKEKIQKQGSGKKDTPGLGNPQNAKSQQGVPQTIEWENDKTIKSPKKETPIRSSGDEIQIKWEEEDSSDVNFFH